jgi:Ras-related protein Rab-6A
MENNIKKVVDISKIEIINNNNEEINNENIDLSFKIILVGESSTGKTSITNKAINDYFSNSHQVTLGFEYHMMLFEILDNKLKLNIWDTCGQEIYRSLITSFYNNTSLAVIVFAINDISSFENVEYWISEVKKNSFPGIRLFLVGNKSDLEKERTVNKEIIDELIYKYNIDYYIETSAKDGNKVIDLFKTIALFLYDDYINYKENNYLENERKSYYLDRDTITSKKEKNCFCF